ncbi:MAG TPA: hypothetical protein VGK93_07030 [Candidatus Eisenbacteria bacterium]|jgi:hypothetical protein
MTTPARDGPRNNQPIDPARHVDLEYRLCDTCGTPDQPAVELTLTAVGGPHDGISLTAALPDDVLQHLAHWLADIAIDRAEPR